MGQGAYQSLKKSFYFLLNLYYFSINLYYFSLNLFKNFFFFYLNLLNVFNLALFGTES